MKTQYLSKEQLAYELNINPDLYENKQEILRFWRWKQQPVIRGTESDLGGYHRGKSLFRRLLESLK